MKRIDARLTKQHLSTKVFKTYFNYLRLYHPDIDISLICEQAGIPLEYFDDGDKWVSILFDRNFIRILRKNILDKDFEFKVGQFSMSREVLGGTLYSLGKNALTSSYIYLNSWKLSKFLNKVVSFEPIEKGIGSIKFKSILHTEQLNEEEKEALSEILPYMMENAAGYYSAIPMLKGGKPATVSLSKIESVGYEISVEYQQDIDHKVRWVAGNILCFIIFLGSSFYTSLNLLGVLTFVISVMANSLYFSAKHLRRVKNIVEETEGSLTKMDSQYNSLVQIKIELQLRLREAEAINRITNQLIQTTTEEEILNSACKSLTSILEFDRAIVLLADAKKKYLEFCGGHLNDLSLLERVKATKFEIDFPSDDPTKVSNVFRKGHSILIADVKAHLKTLNEESQKVLGASGSKSFICVPIRTEDKTLGVLLCDNYISNRTLETADVSLLEVVGQQVAIALEKQRAQNEAVDAYMELDTLAKSYSRFVPWETIKLLGYQSVKDVDITAGKELNMAIVFCDIRGFTTMSEKMSPVDSVAFLNSYFTNLAPVFQKYNGIIDKFLGDGIMALFLDPKDAVLAMAAFQKKLNEYNEIFRSGESQSKIKAGIGLHFGKVLLGAVGFKERLSISVVSDAVNLASRLDGLTKKFGVDCVCTDEVVNRLESAHGTRLIAQLKVEGRDSLTNVYEVFSHLDMTAISSRDKSKDLLEEIVTNIGKGQFEQANEAMERALMLPHQNDPVFDFYKKIIDSKLHVSKAA
jgi:class 3 adenylate cyclase